MPSLNKNKYVNTAKSLTFAILNDMQQSFSNLTHDKIAAYTNILFLMDEFLYHQSHAERNVKDLSLSVKLSKKILTIINQICNIELPVNQNEKDKKAFELFFDELLKLNDALNKNMHEELEVLKIKDFSGKLLPSFSLSQEWKPEVEKNTDNPQLEYQPKRCISS